MFWCLFFTATSAIFASISIYLFSENQVSLGIYLLMVTIANILFTVRVCMVLRMEEQLRALVRPPPILPVAEPSIVVHLPAGEFSVAVPEKKRIEFLPVAINPLRRE